MLVEALLILVMLLLHAIFKDRKPRNMPPGPIEIPFIGNSPVQYLDQMMTYMKKYGNIVTTRLGNSRTVFINDFPTSKEAYASIDFVDRPNFFSLFKVDSNEQGGIVFSNGDQWVHDRRFVLRNLRDLGMGKTYLEQAINFEAQALVDHIKSLGEKPIKSPQGLRTAVLNVIWQMTTGKRYDLTSSEVDAIFKVFEDFREQSFKMFFSSFFPILDFFPKKVKNYFLGTHVLDAFSVEMHRLIQGSIDEHKLTLDPEDPRDIIDEYLIDMEKQKNSENSLLRVGALEQIVADLFAAGSDTVTTTLKWAIHFSIMSPEAMKRCQEQIDKVVPLDTLVSLEHREELPYVEAFVAETLRHSSMIFMGLQRSAVKDTTLNGYFIPKGTNITTNSYFIHHDPEYWDNPEEFRPERFLDQDGKFQIKVGRSLAFGSGRRQCAGEPLARMELFLFTAALLQNFTIELPPGKSIDHKTIENIGTRISADQKLIYRVRK